MIRGPSFHILVLTIVVWVSSPIGARRLHRRECSMTWPAINGDTCYSMARDWALDESLFRAMNPNADCSKLVPNQEYCVEWTGSKLSLPTVTPTPMPSKSPSTTPTSRASTTVANGLIAPSPVQSGVAYNCQRWYFVVHDDTCQKIVDIHKTFTLSQFYIWNPAVGANCNYLQLDVYVCVGVPGTSTLALTPTATTKSTITTKPLPCKWDLSKGVYQCPGVWPAPPGPTQGGVPYNCIKWVFQKDGIYCADMAKAAGITLDRFYALNPAVGTNCGGLWPGYAYCLAIG